MGKMQRNKGVRGELEVFRIIEDHLGIHLQRNSQEQYETGGADQRLHNFVLEIKRCEDLKLRTWWAEAVKQIEYNEIPTLIYRQSRQPWRVMIPHCTISPILYANHSQDEDVFFAFENTVTMLLEPLFMDVVREVISNDALEAMRSNVGHTH